MPAAERLERRVNGVRAVGAALGLLGAAGLGSAAALAGGHPAWGFVAAAAIALTFLGGASRLDAARRLERLDPALDGAVTAFVEGGGGRLREPLAAWVLERHPRASYRGALLLVAAGALALFLAPLVRPAREAVEAARALDAAPMASRLPAPPYLRVSVEVTPPVYAHRPTVRVEGAERPIPALKGSTATVRIETSFPSVELTEEGGKPVSLPVADHVARRTLTLDRSTALRIGADLVLLFDVVPDRAPEVELTLPREDRTVTAKPGPLDVNASARDDLGLTSLAVLYTLAHGRGEGMTFKSGRLDAPPVSGVAAASSTRVDPVALGLGPGDTLVVWAEATDGNAVDGPSRTASSVRLLRWDEELARIEMRSSAPAVRPLDGPLSQREILARTVRLLGERLPKERRRERSAELAAEQGKLRDAFGFFLRAEQGDAVELDVETKESAELGSDRARKLLAEAVSAMWASEGELSAGNPAGSVPHQRLALKRLDEAFGNERYALRALAPPKAPVDERRRLKGDAKGLLPRTAAVPPRAPDDPSGLGSLARRLLLLAEGIRQAPARELADQLWALPESAGVPRSALAAPLYAARTPEETSRAARAAADALLRALAPEPPARPAVAREEALVFRTLSTGTTGPK